jgi:class 3 adenylate cyclase
MDVETRVATILFTDIHNYSVLARVIENDAPHFIQTVYERLGDEIVRREGEIVKYMGDAMMAIFDDGMETEAVQAALAMRKAYAEMVRELEIDTDSVLEVGLNRGRVIVGLFGHPSHVARDVFGEAVNEAAVIMHHRGVAVTDALHRIVGNTFSCAPLPPIHPKWRNEPLRVWEVLAAANPADNE